VSPVITRAIAVVTSLVVVVILFEECHITLVQIV